MKVISIVTIVLWAAGIIAGLTGHGTLEAFLWAWPAGFAAGMAIVDLQED